MLTKDPRFASLSHKERGRIAMLERRIDHLEHVLLADEGEDVPGRSFDIREASALRWALDVIAKEVANRPFIFQAKSHMGLARTGTR